MKLITLILFNFYVFSQQTDAISKRLSNPRTNPEKSIPRRNLNDYLHFYKTGYFLPPSSISDLSGILSAKDYVSLNKKILAFNKKNNVDLRVAIVNVCRLKMTLEKKFT